MTPCALALISATALFALIAGAPFIADGENDKKTPSNNLYPTVRRAFQSDVQHEWILTEASGGFSCPYNITHTTWNQLPSGSIGVNHNTIIQDNARCDSLDSERRLEFFESQHYDDDLNPVTPDVSPLPAFLKSMLMSTGANINMLFDHRQFGEEFLFGFEALVRVCGTAMPVWQPGTTAFISRPFAQVYTSKHISTDFVPGYKYMVMVPRYQEAYCVYRVMTPVDPSAEPEPDSTPLSGPPVPTMPEAPPIPDLPTDAAPEAPESSPDTAPEALEPSPDAEMSMSPEPTTESDAADETESQGSDPVCFPAAALVTLSSGATVPMHKLSVGDRVQVGPHKFSTVHGFTHRDHATRSEFVQLTLANGARLRASKGHFVPTADGRTEPADRVFVGDFLLGADGAPSHVVRKEIVSDVGLYNPQTTDGVIVVDGVVATTYTTAVAVATGHSLLMPVRALFKACGADLLPGLLAGGISRFAK